MSEHLTPIFPGKYLDEFVRTEIARLGENKKMKAWQHAETVKQYIRLVPGKLQENAEIVADVLEPSVTNLSRCEKTG